MTQIDTSFLLHALFLIILLGFILKAFLSSKNKLNQSFSILLWGGIFLILIALYAFRFELEFTKNKILAVLLPNYVWVNEAGQLSIARNYNGHFYIDAYTKDNQIIHFLIDTGATDIALTMQDAVKLGYNVSNLKYTRQYKTANGISHAAPVIIPQLTIGKKTFYNIEGHISSGELDISLLGMSLIDDFKDFKITKDTLILSY